MILPTPFSNNISLVYYVCVTYFILYPLLSKVVLQLVCPETVNKFGRNQQRHSKENSTLFGGTAILKQSYNISLDILFSFHFVQLQSVHFAYIV